MVKNTSKLRPILLATAVVLLCVTAVLTVLSLPYFFPNDDPAPQVASQPPEPEEPLPEVTDPTEEPTLPPPPPNPYGDLDFQYQGRFLKLIEGESISYGRKECPQEQAQGLFGILRELDERGAKHIYVHSPDPEGIGLAVYNRLIRAAGFDVADASNKCF